MAKRRGSPIKEPKVFKLNERNLERRTFFKGIEVNTKEWNNGTGTHQILLRITFWKFPTKPEMGLDFVQIGLKKPLNSLPPVPKNATHIMDPRA